MLFKQLNRINYHAAINRLQHVIDGEQADGSGREGFHFDAGAANGFGRGGTGDRRARCITNKLDGDAR
jgi:hypothetical protein